MSLAEQAKRLAARLKALDLKIVFAESCTAGLVSASLARIPGISAWHCGSSVTYREETKQAWLDISATDLQHHSAVSAQVTRAMAQQVLVHTLEAVVSAAVTGHLGPNAPAKLDGVIYVAVARRTARGASLIGVWHHRLRTKTRIARQQEATAIVLKRVTAALA